MFNGTNIIKDTRPFVGNLAPENRKRYIMYKTNLIIVTTSVAIGGLWAWIMGYQEWWQWILSIIVTGIIIYIVIGIFMFIVTIVSLFMLHKYWKNNKTTIKFNLYVIWEKLWRPFSSLEEVGDYVRSTYNFE